MIVPGPPPQGAGRSVDSAVRGVRFGDSAFVGRSRFVRTPPLVALLALPGGGWRAGSLVLLLQRLVVLSRWWWLGDAVGRCSECARQTAARQPCLQGVWGPAVRQPAVQSGGVQRMERRMPKTSMATLCLTL